MVVVGGVPSDYFVSTQLQLWLFCCWGCGCCWAVTITVSLFTFARTVVLHPSGIDCVSADVCIEECNGHILISIRDNFSTVWEWAIQRRHFTSLHILIDIKNNYKSLLFMIYKQCQFLKFYKQIINLTNILQAPLLFKVL